MKEATWTEPSARESKRNQWERRKSTYGSRSQLTTGDDHVTTAAAVDRADGRHGAEVFGARRTDVEVGIDRREGGRAGGGVGGAEDVCQSAVLSTGSLD